MTEAEFWMKVEKSDGCWLWHGSVNQHGYGHLRFAQKSTHAHRVSWLLVRGPIPPNLQVLHKCDVPACVNPDHLFLGSISDNVQDSVAKKRHSESRKTACKHGHEFTPANTIIRIKPNGRTRRDCRTCLNKRTREWQKRQGQ